MIKFVVLFEHQFSRNYIHVRDVANAFLLGIDNFQDMKNNIYNVGLSDANLTKLELCKKIQKFINYKIIIDEIEKDPDQRNYIVSNKNESKGFKPQYSVDDGIRELIQGFKSYKFRKYSNV